MAELKTTSHAKQRKQNKSTGTGLINTYTSLLPYSSRLVTMVTMTTINGKPTKIVMIIMKERFNITVKSENISINNSN